MKPTFIRHTERINHTMRSCPQDHKGLRRRVVMRLQQKIQRPCECLHCTCCMSKQLICWASFEMKSLCPILNINWYRPCCTPVPSVPEVRGIYRHRPLRSILFEDLILVQCVCFVVTRMPGGSCCRRFRFLALSFVICVISVKHCQPPVLLDWTKQSR